MRLLVIILALAGWLVAGPAKALPGEACPYEGQLRAVAGSLWVERAGQVQAESGFNPLDRSGVGAEGLVQVMPGTLAWWKGMGWVPKTATGYDIPACFQGQNGHMLWLRRYWQDLDHRLAAYNAGQGSVLRAEAYAREMGWEDPEAWLYKALPSRHGTGPLNAKQTQDYLKHNAEARATILAKLRALGRTP
jgi:hypothetical protein